MKIKDFIKVVGIILLVFIILMLIHSIKNYMIVRDLQNKISKYENSTNYHIKSETTEPNGIIMTVNSYRKDDKQATFIERKDNEEIAKISQFSLMDKKGFNAYIERGETKIAQLETEGVYLLLPIYNGVENDTSWHTFLASMFTYIRSEEINDKDCYVVSNYKSAISLMPQGGVEYYIDKDTGLMVKSITNEQIAVREYEFDNVDDSIFEEPDISEYEIKVN